MWDVQSNFVLLDRTTGSVVKKITVKGTWVSIGQDPQSSNLRLNHSDVAPHHCTICVWPENKNGHMFLEPEGGAVVLLNGLKVEKAQALNKGDVFSIGPFDFGVVDSGFLSKVPRRRGEFMSLLDLDVREDGSDVISDEIDWYIDNYLHRPQND